jgi:two-component system, chemotaxis family, CheB/CheR fusion protein
MAVQPDFVHDPAASDDSSANARDGARKRRDPNEPAAVIGIGASAGGIAPLQEFFEGIKPDTGLGFVVVMHLSPEFDSQLGSIIQQKTSMPVTQVTEAVKVRPNHVYVIPPNHQMTFEESMLHLIPPQQGLGRRVAIDLFFRTLAHAYGQRAVCIIMSGSDSDGVIGLKHIRAQGGLTIAQEPTEAAFDSMPLTAISTGMVDWVLPVAAMPKKLVEFLSNEHRMKLPPEIQEAEKSDVKVQDAPGGETISDETRSTEDEAAIGKVLAHVRARTGHDFSHYKRATVLRRIARRLQVNSLESIPQYLEFLRKHPEEARALLQDLLIGVTHFFRDRDAFASLESHIPQIFATKKKEDEIRVWVAGCASGEEAYSIAMLLCEYAVRLENPPKVQLFATDIDENSISYAREGLYPSMIEADISPERLRDFFVRNHGRYRVKKEIREKVLFAAHNVLGDAPFARCDLISCRNLLIYLTPEAQKQVLDIFHFALRPGGLLFLGAAENHGPGRSLFSAVDAKERIFLRRSTPRPSWKVPVLPTRTSDQRARPVRWRSRLMPALTQDVAGHAGIAGTPSLQAGATRRGQLFGELHLRLLEEYGPPSIVVNESHEIVHLSAGAGRYLQFVAGEPTANITKVIIPALQIELRTALFKAAQTAQTAKTAPATVELDAGPELIVLEVRPMKTADEATGYFLLLFERQVGTPAADALAKTASHGAVGVAADDEIHFLKEQLAATVEQYEAANEELKASNEELQAMNEELRSATEQLETSKEELQSVNEELITVNHELKTSVEDLSRTNADLNNLMAATDVGTIFLDRQLRIHRFTPSAQKIFNLISSDIGRPLADITSALKYEGFMNDAETVLRDLHTIEREVCVGESDHWYMTRLTPYRESEDRIAGVVATFVDITARKRVEDKLRTREQRYRTLFNRVPVAVYSTNADGVIRDFNQRAVELWGRTPEKNGEKFCGSRRRFYSDGKPMPYDQYPIARVLRGEELSAEDCELILELKDGTRKNVFVSPIVLKNDQGEITGAIDCLHDITARKRSEEALRETEESMRRLTDAIPQIVWTNGADGTVNYFNRRWYEYTGLSYEKSVSSGWEAVHPDDVPVAKERWARALEAREMFDCEYRLRDATGEYRWFIARNVPLRRNGEILGWFGSATDIHDLKEAEQALRESEERYRLMVDGARDYAIFLLSPSNDIVYWSAGAERVFGWSAEEAVGQSGELVFTPEDRAVEQEEKEIETALREGCASDRRWHLRKDGSRIWVDGVMRRLDDEKTGALRGFAKIARDATEQREAEQRLQQAHEQLEQRVKDRTAQLLAINDELQKEMKQRQSLERQILDVTERERARVGQDLHDGLCQELTATAFLLKSRAKELARKVPECATALEEAAATVNENAGRARDLARGFHPSELGAGGLSVALRELSTRVNERVPCRCECERGLRLSDETVALHIYRVAQEAANNALKHARASEIIIRLRKDDHHLVLSVTDDGIGMRSPTRKTKTMGIHMMKYRADVCGGKLEIESGRGRGTTVTCKVPLKP